MGIKWVLLVLVTWSLWFPRWLWQQMMICNYSDTQLFQIKFSVNPDIYISSLFVWKQTMFFNCWSVTKIHIAPGAIWSNGIEESSEIPSIYIVLSLQIKDHETLINLQKNLKLELCFLFLLLSYSFSFHHSIAFLKIRVIQLTWAMVYKLLLTLLITLSPALIRLWTVFLVQSCCFLCSLSPHSRGMWVL